MRGLQRAICDVVSRVNGRVGACVLDLGSGKEVGSGMDEPLPMASVCKVPILVTAFREQERGGLDLGKRVEMTPERRCGGSGLLSAFDPGAQLTLRDYLLMMIVVSDNAATDVVLERVAPTRVTAEMQALGLPGIRLDRPIRQLLADIDSAFDPRLSGLRYGEWDDLVQRHPDLKAKAEDPDERRRAVNEAASDRDTATARDMARLCAQIAQGQCGTRESCEAILRILDMQQLNGRLPRSLPAGTRFPHKTGTLGSGAVVNDAGILYIGDTAVASIAVLSRDVRDPLHETADRFAELGRTVYDHYASRTQVAAAAQP